MQSNNTMNWLDLSEAVFGLVVSKRVPVTKYHASMFADPYPQAFDAFFAGATKTKLSAMLGPALEAALDAAGTISEQSAQDVEWQKNLLYAAKSYALGKKLESASKKLIRGDVLKPEDATAYAASFKDISDPDSVGLVSSKDIDLEGFEPTMLCGYPPIDEHLGGIPCAGNILVMATTGQGKCFSFGTKVLMWDGTVKEIQDIRIGDLVMGPDSNARVVLSLAHGFDNMYKVTPIKGDSYTVNSEHILSLKMSARVNAQYLQGDIVNISVKDYLNQSNNFRRLGKGWRTGVEFWSSNVRPPIDPYFIGLWLADGSKDTMQITTNDSEVIAYLNDFAVTWDCHIRYNNKFGYSLSGTYQNKKPELLNAMRDLGITGSKHIPHIYKTSLREDRLQLLAGILDGDGYLYDGCFDIIQKIEVLADDIVYLARSLGFAAYKHQCEKYCQNGGGGTYYRICISGNLIEIPLKVKRRIPLLERAQIKSHLVTGITVEPVGYGEYFGFNLNDDGLFLLGDFTVTHNSLFSQQFVGHFLKQYPEKKVAIWSLEMTNQQYLYRGVKLYPTFKKAHDEGRIYVSDSNTNIYDVGIQAAASGVDMIVVDYVDYLIKGEGTESKYAEIYIQMNNISRSLGIPFMMLLQPNRNSYEKGIPQMYHARYSGMAENVSAQFWVLYEPKTESDTDGSYPYVENSMYIVAHKQRFGWKNGYRGPGAIIIPKTRELWSAEPGDWVVRGEDIPQEVSHKKKRSKYD